MTSSGGDSDGVLAELIRRVSAAAEADGTDGLGHAERVGRTCALLGHRIGLDDSQCELLRLSSPLHDIGKIAIPPEILAKRGPLSPAERRTMQRHTELGRQILSGSGIDLLELAAAIAWTHHERYDGTGYPRGLARDAIPLEGRITSVADVFDALLSERAFRPPFPLERALRLMQEGRGAQFDPLVLDAFTDTLDDVLAIRTGVAGLEGLPIPPRTRASRPRRRRAEAAAGSPRPLPELFLREAVEEAIGVLRSTTGDRQSVDAALGRLREVAGTDLVASVYLFQHERLWCLAQKGYDEIRDGFPLDRGVMARAFRTGEPQFVAEVAQDPDFIAATWELRSEAALPVGERLGVLNVETRRFPLPDQAAALLQPLATALASRMHRLDDELGLGLSSLARLFVYASSLRGTSAIAEFSTRTLGRLLDLESAQLSLGRTDTGFVLASFWRRPDSVLDPLPLAELERFARLSDAGETAITIFDLESSEVEPVDELRGRRWLVWLPLLVGGDEIGVLAGCAQRHLAIDDENVEAATLFAPHAAALIDVAQTLRREQRAAVTDSLTGLLNRRGFEQRFREEIERAERAGRQLAVVVVDCDGLKEINDRGGHELGDSVLLLVARCLRTHKRSGDIAGRLGGDEFAVLMPEIEADGALVAAERLRRSLVDQVLDDGQLVTATFGVAIYPPDGGTPSDLLRAADRALYVAKASGRNRTALYGETLAV